MIVFVFVLFVSFNLVIFQHSLVNIVLHIQIVILLIPIFLGTIFRHFILILLFELRVDFTLVGSFLGLGVFTHFVVFTLRLFGLLREFFGVVGGHGFLVKTDVLLFIALLPRALVLRLVFLSHLLVIVFDLLLVLRLFLLLLVFVVVSLSHIGFLLHDIFILQFTLA